MIINFVLPQSYANIKQLYITHVQIKMTSANRSFVFVDQRPCLEGSSIFRSNGSFSPPYSSSFSVGMSAGTVELAEEMSITLPPSNRPVLFGVYNDPMRDTRRHTASAVYVVEVPEGLQPTAGDSINRLGILLYEQNQNASLV